ncbi:Histidine kinase-, DNA gyrase B-, and HSP90-like ATPase [Amycolatopsis arida]|uniref:Histidine kinase-, DNA gyrase B-, and HSP90-like ATPase n=1 Tax=Amycolatopsis arida TaxID=587909 RepID=A0A1I5TQC9_9PSEU|nr:ATP-binding protein [Amycolatopsis arida]TDX96008.1 histidine kinase/DNA gyrase B/HSP90-like ATPase [Amycolatopsis arida]SFP85274.1 Histidine kinase-, DNA gyrase B-, and HSP90-like ATPase [Amycolatopsis arida]
MSAHPGPHFLFTLLRGGAPAVATAPAELGDTEGTGGRDDPDGDANALRALRRIQRVEGPATRDDLLLRAARFVALIPLAYRILAVPGAVLAFLSTGPRAGVAVVLAVAGCSVLLSGYGVGWLLRARFRGRTAARLLGLDVVFAVLAHLAVAAAVPPAGLPAAAVVPGKHLLGAIALLTLVLGVGYGATLVLVTLPLRVAMEWVSVGRLDPAAAVDGLGTTVGVLVTATGALLLAGLGTRLALAHGITRGRQVERAAQHRRLHDTVLQTLEAMPLQTDIEKLHRMARTQATELRAAIEADSTGSARPLSEKLTALAAEMARHGLRTQLVIADLTGGTRETGETGETLPEARQAAVRDAVREALRNTIKHAGTDEVLVRVEERDGGIATIIRDHGTGFNPARRPAGYGISESIVGRLAEVGGSATVESAPGSGTRVTLWVPR